MASSGNESLWVIGNMDGNRSVSPLSNKRKWLSYGYNSVMKERNDREISVQGPIKLIWGNSTEG